jgi:hypothetical protein
MQWNRTQTWCGITCIYVWFVHVVCHLICRAKHHGWQDTYVFTKAMGEMVINSMRGEIPVVIIRPSVIGSTLRDPFPGWIQGNRSVRVCASCTHIWFAMCHYRLFTFKSQMMKDHPVLTLLQCQF